MQNPIHTDHSLQSPSLGRQSNTLKIVLGINLLMFVLEISVGLSEHSISLIADSLDMLGDALMYGVSLYVLYFGSRMKIVAALLKGLMMAAFGVFVLAQAVYKIMEPSVPSYEAIGFIAILALLANGVCLSLLSRHLNDDINMRSVWLCSRNDIIANFLLLLAGFGVWLTDSYWPDCLVGIAVAMLFLVTSFNIIQDSLKLMNQHSVNRK